MTTSITEDSVFKVLGDFLTAVLPAACLVTRGQLNFVAQPANVDHVVMWPLGRPRLATNEESYSDVAFTGSIALDILTVSQMLNGTITQGLPLSGAGVAAGSVIGAQIRGTAGGAGTYAVSPSQTVSSTTMQAGQRGILQRTQADVQIDVHGPASADNAQIISTLFRDKFATELFATSGFDLQALHVDDPKQIPFTNGEQQVEERWVVVAHMQINPIISVSQQSAGALSAAVVSAERAYPI